MSFYNSSKSLKFINIKFNTVRDGSEKARLE
ncbi:hypothetical protein FVB9532_01293 [Mesonia oceanica]|uniref:Uncharacterized protein n=1 Tax=Mesonia oceanica TaxID=2687242 RepID=A0AC61Y6C9_9FLAO|nr:hypothetical protein FVB9532_01293 [Mesonia oceanica]